MMYVVGQCHCRTRCVRCALRAQSNGGVLPYFLLFRYLRSPYSTGTAVIVRGTLTPLPVAPRPASCVLQR